MACGLDHPAGLRRGVFDTRYPHETAVIITGMGLHLADAFIDAIKADGATGADISGPHAHNVLAASYQAFERIPGAQPGSLAAKPVGR